MAKRRKQRGSLLTRLAVFCFVGYIAATLIGMQLEVLSKRRELESLQQGIEQQELLNAETERLLSLSSDEEYIERIARDRLGFAYPDERVFIDRSGN